MQAFAELVTRLDQTTKTSEKIAALTEYLDAAPDADKLWAIALFADRRPRRSVKTSALREWAAELSGIPLWLVEDSYHVAGDLAETLALLVPGQQASAGARSLADWMRWLAELAGADDAAKRQLISGAWQAQSVRERFVFNKLITGGFRLGVSKQLMIKALARHTGLEEAAVAHRIAGSWEPGSTAFGDLFAPDGGPGDPSKPYPFFLAYPLEDSPDSLGDPAGWQAEWKWDGIRAQLIVRGGELFLWSRGEELITDKFPELHPLRERLPGGTALDGELLSWKDGAPLPFALLQTRIGRKNVTRKTLAEAPAAILAYDLLEWQGRDLRSEPLHARRALLAQAVEQAGLPGQLRLSPALDFGDWEALARLRAEARAHHSEGLMLKRLSSAYQTGRRRGDWWKWKVDALSVDAVMIYAQRGHGRRANLFTDYTFAVWDGDALVPFAKAYSGLTDAEMLQVDAWVKRNTLERFGPVHRVQPELVFEIGFEGISRSSRHKSGIALRFPRMLRWRQDKPAAEADTLETLGALLAQQG
ncbi:MAG: ATP-dependent DNA ligase [Bacteroidia bacterium]|nr:ATP-dependent DNA ligase [Bacteroidia bacterium]